MIVNFRLSVLSFPVCPLGVICRLSPREVRVGDFYLLEELVMTYLLGSLAISVDGVLVLFARGEFSAEALRSVLALGSLTSEVRVSGSLSGAGLSCSIEARCSESSLSPRELLEALVFALSGEVLRPEFGDAPTEAVLGERVDALVEAGVLELVPLHS